MTDGRNGRKARDERTKEEQNLAAETVPWHTDKMAPKAEHTYCVVYNDAEERVVLIK